MTAPRNANAVYLAADARAQYYNVEDLVDNLRSAGFEKIVLLTEGGGSNRPEPGGGYKVGRGVSGPVVIYKPEPEYSKEALEAKYEGDLILSVVVGENGALRELKVVRPLGMGLDEKAIEAVKKWRFRPGMKDGHPVPVQGILIINFRLP